MQPVCNPITAWQSINRMVFNVAVKDALPVWSRLFGARVGVCELLDDLREGFAGGGGGEEFGFGAEGEDAGDDFEVVVGGDGDEDAAVVSVFDLLLGVPGVFEDPAGGAL